MNDQPGMDPNQAATAAALEQLKRKQEKRALWSKIAGVLVLVVVLLRAAIWLFGSNDALMCSDSKTISTLTSAINEREQASNQTARVASIDGIQQLSHDSSLSRCSARLTLTDQSGGTMTYHVDRKRVEVDSVN